MAAILSLLVAGLAAAALLQLLFPAFPAAVRLAGAVGLSVVLTAWTAFGAATVAHGLGVPDATAAGASTALAVNAAIVAALRRSLGAATFRLAPRELGGMLAALVAAGWVVQQRLGGDPLKVSANTWGDTALHIGIARSFSQADNYPPQLPIFAGEPIRYHFGVDFYAGTLEELGLPIDWAFNVPATLGLAAIMVLVASLAWHLWRDAWVGVLAAVLFLTNGSLAFLRYLERAGSLTAALDPARWWNLDVYNAIGPFQGDEVISIFLTLNPYLTQTHLIVIMVVVLFVLYALLWFLRAPGSLPGRRAADVPVVTAGDRPPADRGRAAALGALLGASFWMNGILVLTAAMLAIAVLALCGDTLCGDRTGVRWRPLVGVAAAAVLLFAAGSATGSDGLRLLALVVFFGGTVLLGPLRTSWPFLAALAVTALPQLLWLRGGTGAVGADGALFFHFGYLVPDFAVTDPASWLDALSYWWLNLGLVLPLVLLAAVLGSRADRALLAAVSVLFVFANVAAFGTDVGGHNHKVINLWETLVNLFAAYALVVLARWLWGRRPTRVVAVAVMPVLLVGLVLSGLLDAMTLRNDARYEVVGDRTAAVRWITDETAPDAVFLTAYGDVYTVPTIAGRRVYLGGFSIWADGMGYDTEPRRRTIDAVYDAPDRGAACAVLAGTGVDYVQISSSEVAPDRFPRRNPDLFPGEFRTAFSSPAYVYYDVRASCPAPATAAEPAR